MNFTFQIGALPRSGSAWIATLLNMHEGVFCFHDALQSFNGKYDLAADSKKDYEHVGDCSSFVCTRPLMPRSAYIRRASEECLDSLELVKLGDDFELINRICLDWQAQVPTLEFSHIFGQDEETSFCALQKLFQRVVPGVALNFDKARMLRPLKVELFEIGPHMFDIEQIKWRMSPCP